MLSQKSLFKSIFLNFKSTRFYSQLSTFTSFKNSIQSELDDINAAGTYKRERIIISPQATNIQVKYEDETILNFCANNYLGLSNHPEVISAAIHAMNTRGAGLSSVRFICGTQDLHKELEQKISTFHGREDTLLYISCFDANGGFFAEILNDQDIAISDSLNHASIIDGLRLCKAKRMPYDHLDMNRLEDILKDSEKYRRRLIITDGVFSMDGDVAPLPDILYLASKYNALVFVDDCHATGIIGESGRGTEEYLGVKGKVHFINSTLGKALGGTAGGYTTSSNEVVDILRQKSRPYLFSNSLPPALVAAASRALDILTSSPELILKLSENTKRFRDSMKSHGFNLMGAQHPICPIYVGDAKIATKIAFKLLNRGIYVTGFSYPVVPEGKARIRVQLSASHSAEDIDKCVAAFVELGKKHGLI